MSSKDLTGVFPSKRYPARRARLFALEAAMDNQRPLALLAHDEIPQPP